jgi:hypothetical protein
MAILLALFMIGAKLKTFWLNIQAFIIPAKTTIALEVRSRLGFAFCTLTPKSTPSLTSQAPVNKGLFYVY